MSILSKKMKESSVPTDVEHLRSLLTSFTADLSLNFLERRSLHNTHKSTILEELQDVISELTHREKNLQAAVGIALMVLDRNEDLQKKVVKVKSKLMDALEKAHHQTIDIQTLQEALMTSEYRNEQINKTLIQTEEMMLINSAELNRIAREKNRDSNVESYDDEIDLLKKDFRSQVESIQKKRWEMEKECKRVSDLYTTLEKELSASASNYATLEARYKKLFKSFENSKKKKKDYKNEISLVQSQLSKISANYQRLKIHSDRLEEELSIIENKDKKVKPLLTHGFSLHSELEIMADQSDDLFSSSILTQGDESIEDALFMKPTHSHSQTPQTRTSSLMSYFKMFSTCQENNIVITPTRIQRKKPPEEYFLLAAQAIKMNSPHIENICSVSSSQLYEKALKEGIPFHKWYIWIESQLNAAYVQQLYKKNRKTLWTRYGSKICLTSP